jgi:hypothetical protein
MDLHARIVILIALERVVKAARSHACFPHGKLLTRAALPPSLM